ncbi:MAG: 3-deoxy-D-manno-octulosonic acid transferase [Planctomycetota bacterium]|jgi:3-deoxy-D-manno-octulosonic-acid transferase
MARPAKSLPGQTRLRPGRLEPLAYDAFYVGALGIMAPSLLYKVARGKYRKGWRDKLGFVPERADAPRVWIHAVSVGEAVAAGVLADGLQETLPGHEVVVSTVTPTGQAVARKRFGEDRCFYLPLDFSAPARRAMARTKPDAMVLMELELWPNLIAAASRAGVPVVVANGRISDRAYPRYRRFARLLRKTTRRIASVGAQTDVYAERFRALGVPPERVTVTGSLKYDGVRTGPDPESLVWARGALRVGEGERLLLGGSTHRTEELAIARAWRELGGAGAWRLAVCPRHPERVAGVEAELSREGFETVRRTRLRDDSRAKVRPDTVVIVDTVGELGRLYHAADLVFVGGSLIPHGGQNPMEPAGLGKAVVFGPHMFNFEEPVAALLDERGAVRVASADELAGAMAALAGDAGERERLGEAGRRSIESRKGATGRTVGLIRKALAAGGGLRHNG